MSGWREAIRELYSDPGNPGLGNLSASQPDPTPQDVAAPTLEQLAKACLGDMRELVIHPNDQERDHCEADDILCKLLRAHGHNELVDLFEKLEKWYA